MSEEELKSVDEKEKELTEEFEKLLKNGKIRYVSNDELYVYSLEIKLNKYKQVIDKIKEYLEITKLIYDDDTCVMLSETWYGKEISKMIEEIN